MLLRPGEEASPDGRLWPRSRVRAGLAQLPAVPSPGRRGVMQPPRLPPKPVPLRLVTPRPLHLHPGVRQALCRGCRGNPDSDWLPRHVHKRVQSDPGLRAPSPRPPGLPPVASSLASPRGCCRAQATPSRLDSLPLASRLLFTHQAARPPLPPPAPPRASQSHARGLCHPHRLLPDTSPEDDTAPLPFSPRRSHSEVSALLC